MVHLSPAARLNDIMSTRFSHVEWNGEQSDLSTALELAIDSHWCGLGSRWGMGPTNLRLFIAPSFYLLSKLKIVSFSHFDHTTSVDGGMPVVMALWNGDIVQKGNEDHDIDCWWPLLFSCPLSLIVFRRCPSRQSIYVFPGPV